MTERYARAEQMLPMEHDARRLRRPSAVATEPYFIRRRWDYFVQHLLGMMPPDNYKITPPEGSFTTGDNNVPVDREEFP